MSTHDTTPLNKKTYAKLIRKPKDTQPPETVGIDISELKLPKIVRMEEGKEASTPVYRRWDPRGWEWQKWLVATAVGTFIIAMSTNAPLLLTGYSSNGMI